MLSGVGVRIEAEGYPAAYMLLGDQLGERHPPDGVYGRLPVVTRRCSIEPANFGLPS